MQNPITENKGLKQASLKRKTMKSQKREDIVFFLWYN